MLRFSAHPFVSWQLSALGQLCSILQTSVSTLGMDLTVLNKTSTKAHDGAS